MERAIDLVEVKVPVYGYTRPSVLWYWSTEQDLKRLVRFEMMEAAQMYREYFPHGGHV
jgi:hypothetical protein